eukprot:GEMP01018601.1.p1 GENE.GEMP01018601.1~~GEMP01018601.1.p1  ORF type:complete len:679 (+),score=151.59 GEMP01018601.1:94-2037(+)
MAIADFSAACEVLVVEATKHCEVDQDSVDYAKEVILSALNDAETRDGLEEEIINSVGEMLEGVDIGQLAKKLVDVAFPLIGQCADIHKGDVVSISDLVLMYGGGRLLLKNSRLDLSRGRRYGIVGQNGAGKSTLLRLIAKKDIKELPENLKVVFVWHAVIAEDENVREYANARSGNGLDTELALDQVGFSEEMRAMDVSELSGGWRMRLALAISLTEEENYDVLLLDEPTNHLDVDAVKWVEKYLLTGVAANAAVVVVSHDPGFLDNTCTDIIHFDKQVLTYHKGNFTDFKNTQNLKEEEVAALMSKDGGDEEWVGIQPKGADKFSFPLPGKLDGITNDKKAIMELKDVTFGYLPDKPVLKNVNAKLSLGSRLAIVGANGAGKSTLMGLLCMELSPDDGIVEKHRNLRLAYIAQHHAYHLKEFENSSPMVYVQKRFRDGWDEELQHRLTTFNEEQQAYVDAMARKMGKYGRRADMCVGRQKRGKKLWYEVKWKGLDDPKQNTYEPLKKLKEMGIEGLARAFDERNQAAQSGLDQRPLSTREICRHFEQFGFDEAMTTQRTIKSFSAGQRSRLTLAAAFWVRPHCVCLDEPTNFLDVETVAALERALKLFRGAVMVVSHNQEFVSKIANETWYVNNQSIERKTFAGDK